MGASLTRGEARAHDSDATMMDPNTRRTNMCDMESMKMSFELLKTITNDFSDEVGRGTFGVVYKAVHAQKEIAVKLLHVTTGLEEEAFTNEFQNLARLKHENIVQLLGYCNESKSLPIEREDGTIISAEKMHLALCFEYVENGNLSKQITDEHQGLEWHTRYKIIKGICEGLKHLREGLEKPIYHLDLKPDNILLDKDMVPKIADFGLSKLIGDERTKTALSSIGTCGYWPPEYVRKQLFSGAFDIFSLGVIITKIMVGAEDYNSCADMPPRQFVNRIHDRWMKKLRETVKPRSLDLYSKQVRACSEIASKCLMEDRSQRPKIQDILDTLNGTETKIPRSIEIEQSNRLQCISYESLRKLTNNFSQERLLGEGWFGRVYKGEFEDGQLIAVKVLTGSDDKHFRTMLEEYAAVSHENIMPLLAYCNEIGSKAEKQNNGKYVVLDQRNLVLCFNYMENGSLEQHISELFQFDWCTCYKIIKGICHGLRYLHEELPSPILHMNLKPSNILLDENMVPRISDFLMYNSFGEQKIKKTLSFFGTMGDLPPEFITKQILTQQFDIYSLGAIILKMIAGNKSAYSFSCNMTSRRFIDYVHRMWSFKLQETLDSSRSLEGYHQQVRRCTEIALKCVEADRHKRPTIGDVVRMLDETETLIDDKLLNVQPMELRFHSDQQKYVSSLQLKNNEDDSVAFKLLTEFPNNYIPELPLYGIVSPRCIYTLVLTTEERPCGHDSFVLYSIAVSYHEELQLQAGHDEALVAEAYKNLFNKAQEKETASDEMQEVTLKSVFGLVDEDASIKIVNSLNCQQAYSIDVHPTEQWIMTTHQEGGLRLWSYQKMEVLDYFVVKPVLHAFRLLPCGRIMHNDNPSVAVCVAKFIAREKWIVAGDGNGYIHVYSYDDQDATSFEGHRGGILSLAVHPRDPYVLSSSSHYDHLIKVWKWDQYSCKLDNSWQCTRIIEGHTGKVSQVIFNPEDYCSFASVSRDCTVKIWGVNTNVCNPTTLSKHPDGLCCVDYIIGDDNQYLITGSEDGTAQIWDMETKSCTKYLIGHAHHVSVVYSLPELGKLLTGSLDGTVRIWDSTTYRSERIIAFNLGPVYCFGYIEKLQRIVVGCHQGIAIMAIQFPLAPKCE